MTTEQSPASPPRRGRSLGVKFALAFLLGVMLVVGAGSAGLYAYGQQYSGKILPGVSVGTLDLSGLTPEAATTAIEDAYAGLGAGVVTLTGPSGVLTIGYKSIGRGPDTRAMLDAALAAGRQGHPVADLIGAPQTAIRGVTVDAAVTYDPAALEAAVASVAATIDRAPVDATLTVAEDGSYRTTELAEGRMVDQQAILATLDAQLSKLDAHADHARHPGRHRLAGRADHRRGRRQGRRRPDGRRSGDRPRHGHLDHHQRAAQAAHHLRARLRRHLHAGAQRGGIDPLVKALAKQVNQKVQDASLKLVNNHVVATGKSREGRTLNVAAMKTAILDQLTARQGGIAVEPLPAAVKAVQPKLTSVVATKYAAKMVPISRFSVYFWVIINNHWGGNIEAPATKINGTVIPPGGTFDFWKVVGDVRKLPGVGPGNAIEGGKITVTGAVGGGICTTSTTLFNAAIHAGMIPLARQNHNEFIDRYPAGLDATVWIVGNTKQTMSFKNDTAYPILIQRIITYAGSKRWLTFKIWSVPNGRKTYITNTVIQPGQRAIDTVVKDPTKPVGYSYRNNSPVNGARVWVTVTIYDHRKLHWTKRYYSNYPAVNGVLVVGTGAK